jgi:hypothetical protein
MTAHKLAFGALLALALCAFVPSAAATIEGPCRGSVAGHDVDRLSATDPSEAIIVGTDDSVPYSFTSTSAIDRFQSEVNYGPYTGQVDDGAAPENQSSASGKLDVSQFSRFGVGVYQVEVHATLADGSTCTAAFLLKVDGSILSSSVGQAAAALSVLAAGGIVTISILAGSAAKTVLVSLKAIL